VQWRAKGPPITPVNGQIREKTAIEQFWETAKEEVSENMKKLMPTIQQHPQLKVAAQLIKSGYSFIDPFFLEPDNEEISIPQGKFCLVTTTQCLRRIFQTDCIRTSDIRYFVAIDMIQPEDQVHQNIKMFKYALQAMSKERPDLSFEVQSPTYAEDKVYNFQVSAANLYKRMDKWFFNRTDLEPARLGESAYKTDIQLQETREKLDNIYWNLLSVNQTMRDADAPLKAYDPPGQMFDLPRFATVNSIIQARDRPFVLVGEQAAFSDLHADILNGTWVQVLAGMKAWFAYTGDLNEETIDQIVDFAALQEDDVADQDSSDTWTPDAQKDAPIIPLVPGTVDYSQFTAQLSS
jgi:hypothetical protein